VTKVSAYIDAKNRGDDDDMRMMMVVVEKRLLGFTAAGLGPIE
jgi:hypothetical protein